MGFVIGLKLGHSEITPNTLTPHVIDLIATTLLACVLSEELVCALTGVDYMTRLCITPGYIL